MVTVSASHRNNNASTGVRSTRIYRSESQQATRYGHGLKNSHRSTSSREVSRLRLKCTVVHDETRDPMMSSPVSLGNANSSSGAPGMETVVAVALGSLAAVFLGALLVLLVICRRQRCYYNQKDSQDLSSDLLEGENGLGLDAWESEEWLAGAERWVDDATGLAPPCIAVLRSCHSLAASLTAIAGTVNSNTVPLEIVDVARRIPPRVDDVVRSLYPPLDARLLEARVAALVLAVTHLALVTKHGVPKSQARKLAFIDQALQDMDSHLLVLRNAALAQEAACSIPASTPV